ncbi:hypothetical protein [Agrococcus casei]|uniref:hypothetical protein n=1 Tax=Agrococcus casei TaxID=343512 RepID=UPI003F909EF7
MSDSRTPDTRSRWGRTTFAEGRFPALSVAIPVGITLAIGAGALTLLTDVASGAQALLIAGAFAFIMSWGFVGLVWALVVDRATLRGAIDNPDDSIGSQWLESAMSSALGDTIMASGAGLVALALTGFEIDAIWALSGVIAIAFFSTAVRYLMAKARG